MHARKCLRARKWLLLTYSNQSLVREDGSLCGPDIWLVREFKRQLAVTSLSTITGYDLTGCSLQQI